MMYITCRWKLKREIIQVLLGWGKDTDGGKLSRDMTLVGEKIHGGNDKGRGKIKQDKGVGRTKIKRENVAGIDENEKENSDNSLCFMEFFQKLDMDIMRQLDCN